MLSEAYTVSYRDAFDQVKKISPKVTKMLKQTSVKSILDQRCILLARHAYIFDISVASRIIKRIK